MAIQWIKNMWFKERMTPGVVYSEDYIGSLKKRQRQFKQRMEEMDEFEENPEAFARGRPTQSFGARASQGLGDARDALLRAFCVASLPGDAAAFSEVAALDLDDPAVMGLPLTRHILIETAPQVVLDQVRAGTSGRDSVEDTPYTIWERVGLAPIHLSRLRPRQFYMPVTDFSKFNYDESSPEEKELRARWLAQLNMFDMMVPASVLMAGMILSFPFHTFIRLPIFISSGISGCMIEMSRCYISALQERQDLDDFIFAKEIWYIKNDEVYEMGLPTLPRGQEKFYQTRDGPGGEYRIPPGI